MTISRGNNQALPKKEGKHPRQYTSPLQPSAPRSAERAFFIGAVVIALLTLGFNYFARDVQSGWFESLSTEALLLSQLVCVLNFRSWKIFVGLFSNAQVAAAEGDATGKAGSAGQVVAAASFKAAALFAAIAFLIRTDNQGVVSFMLGFSAFIMLGLVLLIFQHLLGLYAIRRQMKVKPS